MTRFTTILSVAAPFVAAYLQGAEGLAFVPSVAKAVNPFGPRLASAPLPTILNAGTSEGSQEADFYQFENDDPTLRAHRNDVVDAVYERALQRLDGLNTES
jgi:hypothetical protein